MARRDDESADGTLDRDRRAVVKLAGAGTLLATAGGGAAQVAPARDRLHLSISHARTGAARAVSKGKYASMLNLEGGHLKLSDSRWLRVLDDQGRSVTVKPDTEAGVRPDDRFVLRIYDGDGTILDEPHLPMDDEDVPLSVSGDTSMFRSEPIFSSYTVEVVDDGSVTASTGERIYGIGYPASLDQDGTTGEIEVTFPLVDEVQPSWAVVLRIVDHDADGTAHERVRTEFEMADDELVTSFDADEVGPVPEGASRNYDVLFYVDGDPETGSPNLWAGGELVLDEDAELTDTATETPDSTASPTETATEPEPVDDDPGGGEGAPGFGVAGALAGLGSAGYLLKRRVTGEDEQ